MLLKNHGIYLFVLSGILCGSETLACTVQRCDGMELPSVASEYIGQGYSDIKIDSIFNEKYLFLTSADDVNKCTVLFEIKDGLINKNPILGIDGKVCNLSVLDKYVISSWRDKGMWNEDIYEIAPDGKWSLLFNDECVGCQQVKRSFFKNGQRYKTKLLSGSDDLPSRKELSGKVGVTKAYLYDEPDDKRKLKAYLVEEMFLSFWICLKMVITIR